MARISGIEKVEVLPIQFGMYEPESSQLFFMLKHFPEFKGQRSLFASRAMSEFIKKQEKKLRKKVSSETWEEYRKIV